MKKYSPEYYKFIEQTEKLVEDGKATLVSEYATTNGKETLGFVCKKCGKMVTFDTYNGDVENVKCPHCD